MSVKKEFLLLVRDIGGLIILFAMPLVLIITVTLIQDTTFKAVSNNKISILYVDCDHGKLSKSFIENLQQKNIFNLVTKVDNTPLTDSLAKDLVSKGKYQLAIVIPEKLSDDFQAKIDANVEKIMNSFGSSVKSNPNKSISQKEIKLYFDPATQMSFKNSVMNSIDKMISKIETQSIYSAFKDQLGEEFSDFDGNDFITFKEIMPRQDDKEFIPNSVQHNVPAWTLFAIFFIVIPLSINIVKEKSQGTFVRLRTNPVSDILVMAGKTITYCIICMIQFYMMIAVAILIFPYLGLPALNIEGNMLLMSIVALFSGFAAIGYGILIGTIAKTQEQSAPFGATSVIILAAIGGVWVPTFAMPTIMQIIAKSTPMNWGINAFYDILLRSTSIIDILPEISLLFIFFLGCATIALLYDRKKRAV